MGLEEACLVLRFHHRRGQAEMLGQGGRSFRTPVQTALQSDGGLRCGSRSGVCSRAGHSPGLGTVQGWAGPRWGGMPVQPCMRGSPLTFDGVGGSVPAMRRARLAIWRHACRSIARLGWYSRARPSRATLPLGVKRQCILRYSSVEDRGRNDASGSHDELWILAASG